VIVLPLQEKTPYYDSVARIMSARWVADNIRAHSNNTVMSPELALRLLGVHKKNFDQEKIKKLAKKINADVVYLYLDNEIELKKSLKMQLGATLVDPDGKMISELTEDLEKPSLSLSLEALIKKKSNRIVSALFGERKKKMSKPLISKSYLCLYRIVLINCLSV
jgi:hypothetical protein